MDDSLTYKKKSKKIDKQKTVGIKQITQHDFDIDLEY